MNADTPFERLVADALSEPMSPELAGKLDDRIADLVALPPIAPPRGRILVLPRGRLRTGLLLAAALLIVVACAVARDLYGTVEAAPQVDNEMADARALTPIPPGVTWPPMQAVQEIPDPDNSGATIRVLHSNPYGRQMVEFAAACMWEGYWLDGHDRGDAPQMATALAGLEKTRTWATFTDLRLTDQGIRALHKQVVDGAERGDPAALKTEYQAMWCAGPPNGAATSSNGGPIPSD
jgi:hypothetical protein